MEARVVQIGTSVGVIVPKAVVKELEICVGHKLDLSLNNRSELILKKKKNAREGWLKAFTTHMKNCVEIDYAQTGICKQQLEEAGA